MSHHIQTNTPILHSVPRPDKKQDPLGLGVLDEPSCGQTDPQLLGLKLKAIAKGASTVAMDVKTLPDAEDANTINDWMDNVDTLHRFNYEGKVSGDSIRVAKRYVYFRLAKLGMATN